MYRVLRIFMSTKAMPLYYYKGILCRFKLINLLFVTNKLVLYQLHGILTKDITICCSLSTAVCWQSLVCGQLSFGL